MSTKKVRGKFYPLQHQEFLQLNQILTQSELSVYLWLKTNDPFGGKLIEADTQKIAEDLGVSRRSVQRALVKLQQEELIELVINKFKYRLKSQSASQSVNNSRIKDDLKEVATSRSSDDGKIALTSLVSPKRHQDRSNDSKIVSTTSVSPSLSETISEREFQTPNTSKTYIDFKKTLSEDESENFLKFVIKAIKSFREPIQDVEAWLASQTKAGQNRWSVYYQNYLRENKASKPDSNSSSVANEAKRKAIANYQKQLNREKAGYRRTESVASTLEFNRLLDNPENQIKRIDKLESQSKPVAKSLSKYVSEGCEHLRNIRMSNFFANELIQEGMA